MKAAYLLFHYQLCTENNYHIYNNPFSYQGTLGLNMKAVVPPNCNYLQDCKMSLKGSLQSEIAQLPHIKKIVFSHYNSQSFKVVNIIKVIYGPLNILQTMDNFNKTAV
jgi:hypothetical protein